MLGVVSRGGRPDLVPARILDTLPCPVLMLVGGADVEVLELNRRAAAHLKDCRIEVVPGATHLFEEAGAMREVERRTLAFLQQCLPPAMEE